VLVLEKRVDEARSLYERAVNLDRNHEEANQALGHVQYKGEWMTPEERERRQVDDEEEEKRAAGLVKWKDQWVTPEDKDKLEQGVATIGYARWAAAIPKR